MRFMTVTFSIDTTFDQSEAQEGRVYLLEVKKKETGL